MGREHDEVKEREHEREAPQQRVQVREAVVRHQREEPHEQNPRGDLRDLRARGAANQTGGDARVARALPTLSSESRNHGLYF